MSKFVFIINVKKTDEIWKEVKVEVKMEGIFSQLFRDNYKHNRLLDEINKALSKKRNLTDCWYIKGGWEV